MAILKGLGKIIDAGKKGLLVVQDDLSSILTALTKRSNKLLQACNKGAIFDYSTGVQAGTAAGVTSRMKYTAKSNVFNPQLIYSNFYVPDATLIDTANSNAIIVKASIEDSSGNVYPVTFSGASSITIQGGGMVKSDPVGIEFATGDIFYVRTFCSVTTDGLNWPIGGIRSDGVVEGKATGDLTASGTVAVGAFYVYYPNAIVGQNVSTAILLSGDSIFAGNHDTLPYRGYGMRALEGKLNYGIIARTSDQASLFKSPTTRQHKIKFADYFTHVVCDFGINDVRSNRTLDQIKADLQTIWTMYSNRGLKVYQCTLTPNTTSTDSWATTTNQTIASSTQNAVRTALNDWIRTCPSPLTGYFDAADLAETARNSGIWKAAYTDDGIHPIATGAAAIAACIDTSKFV